MNYRRKSIRSNRASKLAFLLPFTGLVCGEHNNLEAQTQAEVRMAISTDVACREARDRSSPSVLILGLAVPFIVRDSGMDSTGDHVWYGIEHRDDDLCWVIGLLTAAHSNLDPDSPLVTIAEYALHADADSGFDDLVAVENLLVERSRQFGRFYDAPKDLPPILQLRRLQIVNRAARTLVHPRSDPLRLAWVLSHSEVEYFEPGAAYHVPAERFWQLYERHSASSDAELIAWTAAETRHFTEECFAACQLGVVQRSHMRYWEAFPRGVHIVSALTAATDRVEFAARYCVPGSTRLLNDARYGEVGKLVDELRASLRDVSVQSKDELLEVLNEIEQECV